MKKLLPILAASLSLSAGAAMSQVVTDIHCDEKNLSPTKGPSPYGPRTLTPPDHDLPGDPKPRPVHAGVNLQVWHNSPDRFQVGGMALLADGSMLLLDYSGKLFHVTGLDSAHKVTRRALTGTQFTEPLGLMVRNNREVFISTANTLTTFDFDGINLTQEKELLKIPKRGGWYGWNTDLETDGTYLYSAFNVRGAISRYDFRTGAWDLDYGKAMRNSHGMGKDDSGRIWFSDNQGNYRPASPIFLLKQGKEYGVPTQNWTTGAAAWQGTLGPQPVLDAFRSDMIWIPYNGMSQSATDIHFLKSGPFKGQALVGDNRAGHINRLIPDAVDGQMQGAVMRMTGGLEAGTYRMVEDAKGNIYLGGLGTANNIYWLWCKKEYGFQKLSFKPDFLGNAAYNDVRSVSLVKDGLLIEFTSDISDLSDAYLSPANYRAYAFSYIKSVSGYYGGPKADSAAAPIAGISKRSNRQILVTLGGLQKETVLALEFGGKLTEDLHLQTTELFYTLNRLSTRVPADIAPMQARLPGEEIRVGVRGGVLYVQGMKSLAGSSEAGGSVGAVKHPGIVNAMGQAQGGLDFMGFGRSGRVDVSSLRSGVYFLRLGAGGRAVAKPFVIP